MLGVCVCMWGGVMGVCVGGGCWVCIWGVMGVCMLGGGGVGCVCILGGGGSKQAGRCRCVYSSFVRMCPHVPLSTCNFVHMRPTHTHGPPSAASLNRTAAPTSR